jgi:very-short-patch-repair endonuclease
MMSPLSLAKFMPAGTLHFDLLVIDEASQMKPEDALGGMLRARRVVVVGDQKQLPPTDFFSRSSETTPEDEFEDIDDESILEGCQKAFREVRRLKWHYRSRCESLIRFSNEHFYRDSPLITFPAARPDSFSIDLVRVDGAYQARRNVAEASRVAEEAVEFMRHHALFDQGNIPTLGIVAVNIEQRDLIKEQLRHVSTNDPLVEEYDDKVTRKGEPVFVKNLENVQGDERDFIFISLTYGREPGATALKQRFGPINGRQGHRRLNVLFTRARMRIGLFTSFGSIDVSPTEVSAEGVRVLKEYLEYAEGRGRAPAEHIGSEADSDFEIEVADRLRAKGYVVETQVGVSGFRIDLGVRDPNHQERFLAGVECDGASYHSSKSARDRDRLREEVLHNLGWDIIRVWSTDWFSNPEHETDKLVRKLEELKSRQRSVYGDYRSLNKGLQSQGPNLVEVGKSDSDQKVDHAEESVVKTAAAPGLEMSLPDEGRPLTKAEGIRALIEFRESVIRVRSRAWDAHRSILRDAMIETFVSQHFTEPDEWFTKVPAYLRQATDPAEKNMYVDRICEIVSRIEATAHSQGSALRIDNVGRASPEGRTQAVERPAPVAPAGHAESSRQPANSAAPFSPYIITSFVENGVQPDASRFYDIGYRWTLRKMIALVVSTEAPIYADVLVERIARAHDFQRSETSIYQTVISAIDRKFGRTKEDDNRVAIWANGVPMNVLPAFRDSSDGTRSHADIPIAELASLAVRFVHLRMDDEDVLRCMADHFGLARLRESTRVRFEKALKLARHSLP